MSNLLISAAIAPVAAAYFFHEAARARRSSGRPSCSPTPFGADDGRPAHRAARQGAGPGSGTIGSSAVLLAILVAIILLDGRSRFRHPARPPSRLSCAVLRARPRLLRDDTTSTTSRSCPATLSKVSGARASLGLLLAAVAHPRANRRRNAAGDFVVKVAKDLGLEHARDKGGQRGRAQAGVGGPRPPERVPAEPPRHGA